MNMLIMKNSGKLWIKGHEYFERYKSRNRKIDFKKI